MSAISTKEQMSITAKVASSVPLQYKFYNRPLLVFNLVLWSTLISTLIMTYLLMTDCTEDWDELYTGYPYDTLKKKMPQRAWLPPRVEHHIPGSTMCVEHFGIIRHPFPEELARDYKQYTYYAGENYPENWNGLGDHHHGWDGCIPAAELWQAGYKKPALPIGVDFCSSSKKYYTPGNPEAKEACVQSPMQFYVVDVLMTVCPRPLQAVGAAFGYASALQALMIFMFTQCLALFKLVKRDKELAFTYLRHRSVASNANIPEQQTQVV